MKKILLANCLALLFACDLPYVENPEAELISGEVVMEDFDSNNFSGFTDGSSIPSWKH